MLMRHAAAFAADVIDAASRQAPFSRDISMRYSRQLMMP